MSVYEDRKEDDSPIAIAIYFILMAFVAAITFAQTFGSWAKLGLGRKGR